MNIKIDNVKFENLKGDLVNIKTGKDKNVKITVDEATQHCNLGIWRGDKSKHESTENWSVKITVDGKTYAEKKPSIWSRIVNFLKGR